jgi:lysophospholipase L1-like esterase
MQQILVYGDSLTWGNIPLTRKRLPFHERWPGVLEQRLAESGFSVRVIEDCLNGRRTVWDDPFKPGRNGLEGLAQRIECHSPLSLVILMLGTNDFQSMHPHSAWHSAQGIATLVNAIRRAPIEPEMPIPPVLVVVPPSIETPKGPIAPKFVGGDSRCVGLAEALQTTCEQLACNCFDSATVISSSKVDGVHLDADQHHDLGEAIAKVVIPLLQ